MNCWSQQIRTLVGLALAGLLTQAHALDPNRTLSQYVREQWTTESGFPGGSVNGFAQTADGYLWIGTDRGLIRFDGFNFRPVSFTSIASASNVSILQLLTDRDGKLWIRAQGAYLLRQEGSEFERVKYDLPAITALSRDKQGGVLIYDIEKGTIRFTPDNVQKLGPSVSPVVSMAETGDGEIWLGTLGGGLFLLTGGQNTRVNSRLPDGKINCMLPIGSDELWVGTDRDLYRGNSNGFRRVELPSVLGSSQILNILRDRDSNTWVATTRGLLRVNSTGISFSLESELRGDGGINALFEDREGNLWIGGSKGIARIRDSTFATYSSASDGRFDHPGPVYVDPAGRTWFASVQGGLYFVLNGRVQAVTAIPARDIVYSITGRANELWAGLQRGGLARLRLRDNAIETQRYTERNGLARNSVYSVYESRDGSLWAGTLNGGVSKLKDGRFTTYTTTNGLASNNVSSILETHDGAMWFATSDGLSSFSNGHWRIYTSTDGLPSPQVNCLFEDSSGTLWSGTSAGLAFFGSNRFQAPHELPDLLREQVFGMTEDKGGRFWIATSGHVLRVPRSKLVGGVVKAADVHEYGRADGLASTKGVKRNRSVVRDSTGRIWISLDGGLSVVDSSKLSDESVTVLPHIEALTVDDKTLNLAASVPIPPSPRRITFEYTGLSLAAPERIRFRYYLENFDSGWSQPVTARQAVYTNLGPGNYRFRLAASNSEGLWNGPETQITLNVVPTYYQTNWFRASCVLAFLALLWIFYRLRLGQLQRKLDVGLEARVNERTRIARELHDTLLQTLHGLMFQFQAVRNQMPRRPDEAMRSLDEAISDTKEAIAESRNAIQGLRSEPIPEWNLAETLVAESRELARAADGDHERPAFELTEEGERPTLSFLAQNEVRRIALEILRNAFRHADARRIEAEVRYGVQTLRLRIRDDGKGIDPAVLKEGGRDGHWGIRGVRERAERIGAQVDFWSEGGAGTEVQVEVPAPIAYEKLPRNGVWSRLLRKVRDHAQRSKRDSNSYRG